MLYISQGNIPSRWAHTFQTMKMAQAFSEIVPEFKLVIQQNWLFKYLPKFNLKKWYGLTSEFSIEKLTSFKLPYRRILKNVWDKDFDRQAIDYSLKQKPDIIYTRSPYCACLCCEKELNTILEIHISEKDPEFIHAVSAQKYPSFLGVVTVTDSLKCKYVQANLRADRIFVWPDAVNPAAFSNLLGKDVMKKKFKFHDGLTALYAGHFYPHKGVQYIVEAAKLLPHINFCLIGGWKNDIARLKASASGIKNIAFKGFLPHELIPEYLCACDFLILPNSGKHPHSKDTSPMKLFEYMASGKPIIASDIPAFKDILQNRKNALLVTPDSSEAIAAGILELIENQELALNLSETARSDSSRYSWHQRANDILEHFKVSLSINGKNP